MKKSFLLMFFTFIVVSASFSQNAETLRSFTKRDMDVFVHNRRE